MYHFDSRVRYSETGEDGCLTLTGVIDLLQDCSTFQSEDCGVGVKYLESRRKVWMLWLEARAAQTKRFAC